MTRFLFVSLPLAGHLDWGGMLATAAVLSRRPAHQVAWASGREVGAAAGRAGVEFFDLLKKTQAGAIYRTCLPGYPRSSLFCCASNERWTWGR